MNIRFLWVLLLSLCVTSLLHADWGAGVGGGVLTAPIGFEDPFAYALVGGVYLWQDVSLPYLEEPVSLRGELLVGRVNSRNLYYADSNLIIPGLAVGRRRSILSFEGYRADLVAFVGYRHYMRELDFNGEKEEFRTPALTAALELWVDSEALIVSAMAVEYMLTLESEPRHSLNILIRLGGWW